VVRLRFETDLATSLKASADLKSAVDKVGDSLGTAAGEARKLELAAKRIVDANLSPQERYNQKLELMARAVKAGKLSMEDAEKTAGRLRKKLDEAGQAGEKTFGVQAVDRIAGYAAGLFGVQQVAQAVSSAFRDVEQRAQRAGDAIFGSLGAFGELQQVSTSQADFNQLVGQARGLVGPVFGAGQEGQAADLVFALRNAGYSQAEIGFITKLGTSRQVRPENLQQTAEGLKKFQDIFGVSEAGNIQGIGRKVFAAAGETQASFSQVAAASTLFGSEAKALGISDEEALAAFVAVEKQSPGVEEAATRLRSLFSQIIKKNLGKGTLSETLGSLGKRGKSGIDLLGETRAAAGFNILTGVEGQGVFQQQLRNITAAQTSDIIESRRFLQGDRQLQSAQERAIAEGQAAIRLQDIRGEAANRVAGRRARREGRLAEQGTMMEIFAGFSDAMFGWLDRPIQLNQEQRRIQEERELERLELAKEQRDSLKMLEQRDRLTPPKPSGRPK
jgi:hypothetical protein